MNTVPMQLAASALCLCLCSASVGRAEEDDYERAMADLKESYESRLRALEATVAEMRGTHPPPSPVFGGDAAKPPVLSIRGFADFEYDYARDQPRDPGMSRDSTNNFAVGDLDFFITSQIAEDVTFLTETLIEFEEDGDSFIDVERALLRYAAEDWLILSIGRGHTALGYLNQTYHHGTWLLTTTSRPLIFEFEDDDGILPVHFVGLEAQGTFDLGDLWLTYTANVANGRGDDSREVQMITDANDQKMVSFMMTLFPAEDVGIGFNVLRDEIPPAPLLSPTRSRRIDEFIWGANAFYNVHPLELAVEFQAVQHDDHTSDTDFMHYGGYFLAARSFGAWKPYYRFDFLNMESGDPYYVDFATGLPFAEDSTRHTVGVRWDWKSYLALKAEYRYLRTSSDRENALTFQSSFAF